MASFGFNHSLSFPTAGQGNDDSGNEIGFVYIKSHVILHVKASAQGLVALQAAQARYTIYGLCMGKLTLSL